MELIVGQGAYVVYFQCCIEEFLNIIVLHGMIEEAHDAKQPEQRRQEYYEPRESMDRCDALIERHYHFVDGDSCVSAVRKQNDSKVN